MKNKTVFILLGAIALTILFMLSISSSVQAGQPTTTPLPPMTQPPSAPRYIKIGAIEVQTNNVYNVHEETYAFNDLTAFSVNFIRSAPENDCLLVASYAFDNWHIKSAVIEYFYKSGCVKIVAERDYDYDYEEVIEIGIPVVFDEQVSNFQHGKWMKWGNKVLTCSANNTWRGYTLHFNHCVIITDDAIAQEFEEEHNIMFSGLFSGSKPESTCKNFTTVFNQFIQVCFAPEDNLGEMMLANLENYYNLNAVSEVFLSVFYFTHDDLANTLLQFMDIGVPVRGTWDDLGAGNQYSEDEKLCDGNGNIQIQAGFNAKKEHRKMLGVLGDYPSVWLGSANLTAAGLEYGNNENQLLITDPSIVYGLYRIFLEDYNYLINTTEGFPCSQ